MAAMSHDALRIGYERPVGRKYGHHQVHAILAYNQNMRAGASPGSYYTNGSCPFTRKTPRETGGLASARGARRSPPR